ncbi:MAG: Asp23/Gls24 family envelope stress response protein, partial [Gaiellaceae bacterium]
MRRDGHVLDGPHGTIRIEGDALAGLVVTAAELTDGARVRRPRRGLDIKIADGSVRVELELAARYGKVIPNLVRNVQAAVTAALGHATGLLVERVDVSVEVLDR